MINFLGKFLPNLAAEYSAEDTIKLTRHGQEQESVELRPILSSEPAPMFLALKKRTS